MWSWWHHSTLRLPRPRCMHDNAIMRRYCGTARMHGEEASGHLPRNHQPLNSTISARYLQRIPNHRERLVVNLVGWHYIRPPAPVSHKRQRGLDRIQRRSRDLRLIRTQTVIGVRSWPSTLRAADAVKVGNSAPNGVGDSACFNAIRRSSDPALPRNTSSRTAIRS